MRLQHSNSAKSDLNTSQRSCEGGAAVTLGFSTTVKFAQYTPTLGSPVSPEHGHPSDVSTAPILSRRAPRLLDLTDFAHPEDFYLLQAEDCSADGAAKQGTLIDLFPGSAQPTK